MYEELLNTEETWRSWELQDYFVVLPAFKDLYRRIDFDYPEIRSKQITEPYNSASGPYLNRQQLVKFLKYNQLI